VVSHACRWRQAVYLPGLTSNSFSGAEVGPQENGLYGNLGGRRQSPVLGLRRIQDISIEEPESDLGLLTEDSLFQMSCAYPLRPLSRELGVLSCTAEHLPIDRIEFVRGLAPAAVTYRGCVWPHVSFSSTCLRMSKPSTTSTISTQLPQKSAWARPPLQSSNSYSGPPSVLGQKGVAMEDVINVPPRGAAGTSKQSMPRFIQD